MAETADNLRFRHAKSNQAKLRTYASFFYQAGSWDRPRKVVARLECSLQSDGQEGPATGMRQEVDGSSFPKFESFRQLDRVCKTTCRRPGPG